MQIIVINSKSDFSSEHMSSLESIGEVHFLESKPDYSSSLFTDVEEKILALGPEIIDWKFNNEFIDKIQNLKAIFFPPQAFLG